MEGRKWETGRSKREETVPGFSLNTEPHARCSFWPQEHSWGWMGRSRRGTNNRHVTLWLDSPSRLAVVTWQVPSTRLLDRKIRSQGKVSSSLTMTMSPTCRTDRQHREPKTGLWAAAPTGTITVLPAGRCVGANMTEKDRFPDIWPNPRKDL